MAKIKITADKMLDIWQNIVSDEDIDYEITDPSAPEDWQGKTVQEILNIQYYAFRHRPMDTEEIIRQMLQADEDAEVDVLHSLTRAFCLLSIDSMERNYSKEVDVITVSTTLEFWLQTEKVRLLENMIEDIKIGTSGERISVEFGQETRQAVIAPGTLNASEIEEATEFGEMSVCEIEIDFKFYPSAASKADYKTEFKMLRHNEQSGEDEEVWIEVPTTSISFQSDMTQKSVPGVNSVRNVGSINLSRVKTIVLVFDGYENDFIDFLAEKSLESDAVNVSDNNMAITLKLTRKEVPHVYNLVVKNHLIKVEEGIENEVHSLTLTTRGIRNGTA